MDRIKFKESLVTLRKGRGLNQQDLAEIFNVTTQAVSKWETGDSIPDITTLEKLSSFYGVSINDLLNGNINNESSDKKKENGNIVEVKTVKKSKKHNVFKAVWFSSFIFLLFVTSFVEYLGINGFSFNFYAVIFSGNMQIVNFLLLISFFVTIAGAVCGIISSFVEENKSALIKSQLLLTLAGFLIYSTGSFLLSSYMSTGLFLLFVLLGVNTYASIFTKKLNDENNSYIDTMFILIYRLIMLATLIFYMVAAQASFSISGFLPGVLLVVTIIAAVLVIPTLVLTIIAYKKSYSINIHISRLVLSSAFTAFVCLSFANEILVSVFIAAFFITNEISFAVLSKKSKEYPLN